MLRIFKQYYPIRNIFFVIGEFFFIYSSTILSAYLFSSEGIENDLFLQIKVSIIIFICLICLYYNDLYDLNITDSFIELSIRLLQSLGVMSIFLAGIYSLVPAVSMEVDVFIASIGFDIVFIFSWRFLYTLALNKKLFDQRIVLLGSDQLSRDIYQAVIEKKDCGYVAAGIILEGKDSSDSKMKRLIASNRDTKIIGYKDDRNLCEKLSDIGIEKIVVGLQDRDTSFPAEELLECRVKGIEVLDGNSFYEMLTGKLIVDHIDPEWLIFSDGFKKSISQRIIKRMIDLVLTAILLFIVSPIMVIVSILIKLDKKKPDISCRDHWRYFSRLCREENMSVGECIGRIISSEIKVPENTPNTKKWEEFRGKCNEEAVPYDLKLLDLIERYISDHESDDKKIKNPIFFSQERVGLNKKKYLMYKFRSMVVNAEKYSGPVWAIESDNRITRIGNFIRKWRIDELPQLWNVLKGEMSFVGPRPEREFFIKQLEKTIPYYNERFSVKPGLTGWAQVCYGYGATEDDAKEKLNYDLFYIKNMSILMELMIVLRTVKIVIFGKGR